MNLLECIRRQLETKKLTSGMETFEGVVKFESCARAHARERRTGTHVACRLGSDDAQFVYLDGCDCSITLASQLPCLS